MSDCFKNIDIPLKLAQEKNVVNSVKDKVKDEDERSDEESTNDNDIENILSEDENEEEEKVKTISFLKSFPDKQFNLLMRVATATLIQT